MRVVEHNAIVTTVTSNKSPNLTISSTDVEVLPSLSLDTTGSEVTISNQASYNVTCSSPKNTMTTLMWRRVVNSVETPVTDGITDTSTNVTTNLMLTITIDSLMEGDTIEYFCTAMNTVGTARTRSLRVRRACEYKQLQKCSQFPVIGRIASLTMLVCCIIIFFTSHTAA